MSESYGEPEVILSPSRMLEEGRQASRMNSAPSDSRNAVEDPSDVLTTVSPSPGQFVAFRELQACVIWGSFLNINSLTLEASPERKHLVCMFLFLILCREDDSNLNIDRETATVRFFRRIRSHCPTIWEMYQRFEHLFRSDAAPETRGVDQRRNHQRIWEVLSRTN